MCAQINSATTAQCLLEAQHPFGQLVRFRFADLVVGRHGHWPPYAAATFDDFAGKLGRYIALARIALGDVFERRAHQFFSTAWQAMQLRVLASAISAMAGATQPRVSAIVIKERFIATLFS